MRKSVKKRDRSDVYIVHQREGLPIVVGRPMSGYAGEGRATRDLPVTLPPLLDLEPLEFEPTEDLEPTR
jgi:hypothetical protein